MPFYNEEEARELFNERMSTEDILEQLREVKQILAGVAKEATEANQKFKKIGEELQPLVERVETLRKERKVHEDKLKSLKPELKKGREAISYLEHLLRRAELREKEAKEWEQLSAKLDEETAWLPWRTYAFPHQIEGAKRGVLAGGRMILGDKRGLGKTLTSLIYLDMLKARRVVVIGPKETLKNFEKEIHHWSKHRKLISLIGKDAIKRDFVLESLSDPNIDQFIVTINLEAWRRDKTLTQKISRIRPDTVLIDEAHGIKDPSSRAFKGVEEIVYSPNNCTDCGGSNFLLKKEGPGGSRNTFAYCLGIEDEFGDTETHCTAIYSADSDEICSVKNVLPMSGTTILNRPLELWPLLYLVDRKSFPTSHMFQDMYLNSWGGFRAGGEKALLEKLGLQYLARDRKSAGVTIPPQTIQEHNIDFDVQKYARQARAYDEVKTRGVLYNAEGTARINMAAMITQILRLRQVITYPMGVKVTNEFKEVVFQCDIDESQKLDYAVDLIHELVEEGERVVLFSQFKAPLHELKHRLSKKTISLPGNQKRHIRACVLDGGTSDYQKEVIRDDFDIKTASAENYRYDVVLGNYKVGGQSINLTAASQMVILDEQWNPGMEDQAFGRIDRLDTPKETTVHILRVVNSIDTWMAALKEKKAQMIEGFETNADMVREMLASIHDGSL